MAVDDSHLRQVGEIVFGSGTNGMGVRKCVLCVCCVCVVCVLFQREGQRASGGRGRDRKGGNGWRSCSFFFFWSSVPPARTLLSPPLCLSAHPSSFSPTRSPPRKPKGGLSLPARCHSPIPTTNIVCPTATLSSLLGTPVCSW